MYASINASAFSPTPKIAPRLARVAKRLDLSEDAPVTVAKLACCEPGCPAVETVATVDYADGQRRSWHIHQALIEVDDVKVAASLGEA